MSEQHSRTHSTTAPSAATSRSSASTTTTSTASSASSASTATTATYYNPETIFLGFLESKMNELMRRQQSLLEQEHNLNKREEALKEQLAQLHFYQGYWKGMVARGGRGGSGSHYRGRGSYHHHNNNNSHYVRPAAAASEEVSAAEPS